MKSNSCQNRNDIAGQSIDIEWHVCAGDTSVQILQKPKAFMSETRHERDSFPERIILASMFFDITSWESPQVQATCLAQAKEVAAYAARFRPGHWCSFGPGSDKTWKYNEERPSQPFADDEWDKLVPQISIKLLIS